MEIVGVSRVPRSKTIYRELGIESSSIAGSYRWKKKRGRNSRIGRCCGTPVYDRSVSLYSLPLYRARSFIHTTPTKITTRNRCSSLPARSPRAFFSFFSFFFSFFFLTSESQTSRVERRWYFGISRSPCRLTATRTPRG